MIPTHHFTRLADPDGIDAKVVERDYVLTHVLSAIAHQPAHQLVFKGGTALRLCYFDDYRYSADLDFSLGADASVQSALATVEAALGTAAQQIGMPRLALNEERTRIEYLGPLGKQRDFKLDIATDELVENATTMPLRHRYADQRQSEVYVYTLEDIAAEKLRCVIQRLQARDLFDLNELLVERALDVESIWESFERKARHKEIDPSRFAEYFRKRMPQWKHRWESEMREHLGERTPEFGRVERQVQRALRSRLRAR